MTSTSAALGPRPFLLVARRLSEAARVAARVRLGGAGPSAAAHACAQAATLAGMLRDALPPCTREGERRRLRASERDARSVAAALASPRGSDAYRLALESGADLLDGAAARLALPVLREALAAEPPP